MVQGSSQGTIPQQGEQITMKNKIRMCGLISVVLNTVYNPRLVFVCFNFFASQPYRPATQVTMQGYGATILLFTNKWILNSKDINFEKYYNLYDVKEFYKSIKEKDKAYTT